MKTFIKKTARISLLFIVGVLSLFFIFKIISNTIKKDATDKIFLFGNSHGATAITGQPKFGDLQTVTLAKSAQSLFWTIKGIEKTISQNNCKNIILELTNNSFTTNFWTSDDTRVLSEKDKIYQLSFSDWKYLFRKNSTKTLKLFFTLPIPTFKTSGTFESKIGSAIKEDLENDGERIKVQHIEITNQDSANLKHIHLIIKENPDIHFIIFRAPMHPMYFKILGSKSYETFIVNSYKQLSKHNNCTVLDYGHKYQADSLFYDLDHLNIEGSKKFTEFIIPEINNTINK